MSSTPVARAPFRPRLAALALVLVLSPVFAEYSSSYLASTGDLAAMAGEMLILIPLYGCPALLIREISVRRGLGWPRILLLTAAFGLLQAGITDRSIFTLTGTEEAYWSDIMDPTWVPAWGVAVGPAVGWVLGHVITTFAAPLAVADRLVGHARGRRLFGAVGLGVTMLLYALAAVAVHLEIAKTYRPVPSPLQYGLVLAGVLALVALAVGPSRRGHDTVATAPTTSRWAGLVVPFAAGAAVMLAADLASVSWFALVVCCAVVTACAALLLRLARTSWWRPATPAAAALGAMCLRAVEAFETPLADGVTMTEKAAHNVGFLVLVLGLLLVVLRSGSRSSPVPAPRPAP